MVSKINEYFVMGKIFFEYLERTSGLHFGVADRFLIRDLSLEDSMNPSIRELRSNAYCNLEALGYDSVDFRRRLASYRRDEQNLVLEWRGMAKLLKK